jgi:hypothetical protein
MKSHRSKLGRAVCIVALWYTDGVPLRVSLSWKCLPWAIRFCVRPFLQMRWFGKSKSQPELAERVGILV